MEAEGWRRGHVCPELLALVNTGVDEEGRDSGMWRGCHISGNMEGGANWGLGWLGIWFETINPEWLGDTQGETRRNTRAEPPLPRESLKGSIWGTFFFFQKKYLNALPFSKGTSKYTTKPLTIGLSPDIEPLSPHHSRSASGM